MSTENENAVEEKVETETEVAVSDDKEEKAEVVEEKIEDGADPVVKGLKSDENDDSDDEKVEEDKKEEEKKEDRPQKAYGGSWRRLHEEKIRADRGRMKAEARAEAAEALLSRFGNQQQPPQQQRPALQIPTAEPVRTSYQTDADYLKAMATYQAGQIIAERDYAYSQQQQQMAAERQQEQWSESLDRARGRYQDYDEVCSNARDVPISSAINEAIQNSEIGPDIYYLLATNPDYARRIERVRDTRQADRVVGRLEAIIESELSKETKPKVSRAPAPARPVTGSSGKTPKDEGEMTPEEYYNKVYLRKLKDKQMARKP